MSEKYEVVCGGCGKCLFFGEVLSAFTMQCGRCGLSMKVPRPKPIPALAEAIVEAMRAGPIVTADGKTRCNCSECRLRRN